MIIKYEHKHYRQIFSSQKYYRGLSFEAISAVGKHAAIVHYVSTPPTDTRITRDDVYLIDSGGQYLGKYFHVILLLNNRTFTIFLFYRLNFV